MQLKKVTSEVLHAYYARLQKAGMRESYIRSIHRILSSAFNDGVQRKVLVSHPCKHAAVPRVQASEIRVLTPEQAQRLLLAIKGHPLEMLITLALATGMRRGELLGLRWDDSDMENAMLHVKRTLSYIQTPGGAYVYVETEPKTASGRRSVALPACVIEVLKRHRTHQVEARLRAKRWDDQDLVFCTKYGSYYGPLRLSTELRRILREVGLPSMRFHDLRHSAATMMLATGVHPKIVQEILGAQRY